MRRFLQSGSAIVTVLPLIAALLIVTTQIAYSMRDGVIAKKLLATAQRSRDAVAATATNSSTESGCQTILELESSLRGMTRLCQVGTSSRAPLLILPSMAVAALPCSGIAARPGNTAQMRALSVGSPQSAQVCRVATLQLPGETHRAGNLSATSLKTSSDATLLLDGYLEAGTFLVTNNLAVIAGGDILIDAIVVASDAELLLVSQQGRIAITQPPARSSSIYSYAARGEVLNGGNTLTEEVASRLLPASWIHSRLVVGAVAVSE